MLRRLILCAASIALLALPGVAVEQTVRVEKDATAFCRETTQPPAIDGQLSDPVWRSGPDILRFTRIDRPEAANMQTWVFLAYDAKGLYIAFRCFEPEMLGLRTSNEKDIFLNDSVEILVDADRDRDLYHHFVLDAKGRRLQETGRGQVGNLNRDWHDPWDAAVFLGENEWTAEVFIPWKTIGFALREGAAIRANFGRNRPASKETSSWNPMPGGFHQPLLFGNIVLGQPVLPLKGEFTISSHIKAGEVHGQLIVSNVGEEAITVTPRIRVYPSNRTSTGSIPTLTIAPNTGTEARCSVILPQIGDCSLDILALRKGALRPEFVASCRISLAKASDEDAATR